VTSAFSESVAEQATLAWLESLGRTVKHGPHISPGELAAERSDYAQAVLIERLSQAIARLNPALPPEALEEGFRELTRPERNRAPRAPARGWHHRRAPEMLSTSRGGHAMMTDQIATWDASGESGATKAMVGSHRQLLSRPLGASPDLGAVAA